MEKRYVVDLTDDQQRNLVTFTQTGVRSARMLKRAQVLLQAHAGASDAAISATLHVGVATVQRLRRRFVEEGLEAAINERPRPGGPRKLSGVQEATIVALACSTPPEGRSTWTMQLLADKVVTLKIIDAISDETVRRILKKTI